MDVKKSSMPYATILILCIILVLPTVIVGCGGNTGVQGYTITALQATGGAPTVGSTVCYQVIQFRITNSSGNVVNGMQLEFTSNGVIAEHTVGNANCENAQATTSNGAVLNTKDDGTVSLEFLYTAAATGDAGFIWATSGAATPALWETADAP